MRKSSFGKFGNFIQKKIVVAGATKASKNVTQPAQQEESNKKLKDETRKKLEGKRHHRSARQTVVEDVQVQDTIVPNGVAPSGTFHLRFP
jgi:hypothetical protein